MTLQSGDIPARPKDVERFIDQFLSAACDSSRRHILECLTEGDTGFPERSVGAIADHLGLAVSTTSEHLKELLQLRLLVARKEGKKTYYRLGNYELVKTFHHMLDTLEDHYRRGILPPASDGSV